MHDTLQLRDTPDGVILPVHAQPGSRRTGLNGIHDGRLKVSVTQVAEKGKANKEIIKLLAGHLELAKSELTIVSGETSSKKQILVRGLSTDAILQRLP